MGESPSSQVFFEIEGLIFDSLQVISYKWLSRKFSIPSNIAKRLLERFVTQNPQLNLEIVYAVSGWTKADPQCYSIQLVPKSKLEGVKAALRENSSVHVYSVQRCLPKDPAQLWSADFVQAIELFNEPQDVNNCLRDNRFSAVACAVVQRGLVRRTSGPTSPPQTSASASKPPTGLQTHPTRPAQDGPHPSLFPRNPGADIKLVKSEIPASPAQTQVPPRDVSGDIKPVKIEMPSSYPGSEPDANGSKANVLSAAVGKRKAVAAAAPAGGSGGGSISNLWGKAASKPKAPSPPTASEPPAPVVTAGDAEARIQAMVVDFYSDEDVEQYASSRAKRTTGRRRMIVEDDDSGNEEADEDDEMIVRLATPDSPEDVKPQLRNGHAISTISKNKISEVNPKPSTPESKILSNVLQDQNAVAGNLQPAKSMINEEETVQKSNAASQEAPGIRGGPTKKKVMHTRIDEKGREVTEVVWITEGIETIPNDRKPQLATAKASSPTNKEKDFKASTERPRTLPRPQPAPSKTPPSRGKSAGKSVGKQQGSIMSFFKKQ